MQIESKERSEGVGSDGIIKTNIEIYRVDGEENQLKGH